MQAATQQNAPTQSATRLRGYIRTLKVTHGYCFVLGDDDESYFLHETEIEGSTKAMKKGAFVEFTPMPSTVIGKNPRATNVVVLSSPVKNRNR